MFKKQPLEVLYKKVILKISQNLQKNTGDGVSSVIELQVPDLQLKTPTQFGEFWETFKNTFYIKHHGVAASEWFSSSKYTSFLEE